MPWIHLSLTEERGAPPPRPVCWLYSLNLLVFMYDISYPIGRHEKVYKTPCTSTDAVVSFGTVWRYMCCGFFHPRIRIFAHPDPHQIILVFLTQINFSKLSEIRSGLFIPDPDPEFFLIPDPAVKKAPYPGSGSATLTRSSTFSAIWMWYANFFAKNKAYAGV